MNAPSHVRSFLCPRTVHVDNHGPACKNRPALLPILRLLSRLLARSLGLPSRTMLRKAPMLCVDTLACPDPRQLSVRTVRVSSLKVCGPLRQTEDILFCSWFAQGFCHERPLHSIKCFSASIATLASLPSLRCYYGESVTGFQKENSACVPDKPPPGCGVLLSPLLHAIC